MTQTPSTHRDHAAAASVSRLTKIYRTGSNAVRALSDISFPVFCGEFLAVMGASGSGKSTLLHLMAGLTEPTGGTVTIDGVDLFALSDAERTRFRRDHIGVVFQSFNLIPTLTTEENILLPSRIRGCETVSPGGCDALLEQFALQHRRRHRPDTLSGGEQQRVALARALSMDPALILADEPTGNLDSDNSEKLCRILRDLCDTRGRTIVLVTHERSVADWADRCMILKDGSVFAETTAGRAGKEVG